MEDEKIYYTPEEVAEKLNVTPKTVRDWLKNGNMTGYKFGSKYRITKEDFNEYLDRSRIDNT